MLSRLCSEPTPFDESFQAPIRQAEGWLRAVPVCRFVQLPRRPHFHAVRTKDGWSLRHHARWCDGFSLYPRPYASFSIFSPSSSTDPAAVLIPANEGGGDPGTSRPYGLFVPDVPALDGSESV